MLKASERPGLLLRLGKRLCVCMRNRSLDRELRGRIRPFVIGRFACWCDKASND